MRMVLHPWIFKINLFIHVGWCNAFCIKFKFTLFQLEIGGFDFTLLKFVIGGGKKKKAEEDPLLLEHIATPKSTPISTLIAMKNGVLSDDETAAIAAVENGEADYKLPNYKLEKVIDKRAVGSMGQDDYQYCKMGEDCMSGICTRTADSGNLKRCRPADGFGEGRPCWYKRDCNMGAGLFCRFPESPEAVCSAEVDDYEPCMDAEQCKNRRCGLSFGIQCVSDDRNCLCIPGLGFKEGTRSVEARNCDSGEVTQENGINICTKGYDTV